MCWLYVHTVHIRINLITKYTIDLYYLGDFINLKKNNNLAFKLNVYFRQNTSILILRVTQLFYITCASDNILGLKMGNIEWIPPVI